METIAERQKENRPQVGAPQAQPEAVGPEASLHPMLQLQRNVGNQAVLGLLRAGKVRPKLAISQPNDPEEKEADAVAERVMRSPAQADVAACSCSAEGGMCAECESKKNGQILRSAAGNSPPSPPASHPAVGRILRSPGQPLNGATRTFFEPRFGSDLGHVRVHTGAEAAASARSINARAYTVGNDIVFGAGEFSAETSAGKSLLAHEIVHTLQDGSDTVRRQDDAAGMTGANATSVVAPPPSEPNMSVATPAQYQARAAVDKALASKDADDVHDIRDFSVANQDERFKLARIVLDQKWVGPFDEYALERLWASFGNDVVSVASTPEGFALWKECVDRGAELDSAEPIERLKRTFVSDITNVELQYLSINRDFVVAQFGQMGIPISAKEQMPEPTMIQQEETRQLQQAAGTLAQLQKAQELSRTIVVGYDPNPMAQLAQDTQSDNAYALRPPPYLVSFFNPYTPPTYDHDPSILSGLVGTAHSGIIPYSEVKAKYDEASDQIASVLTAWPQLYAISRENDSAQTSTFARTENVTEARSQLATGMRLLIGDIEQAVAKLDDGSIDPLDLIPIHQQLLRGMPSPSGVHWESKLPEFIGKQMQTDHDFYNTLRDLGIQTASAALFMLAPFTGGASIFLALAGLGLAGLKYHLSAQEYEGLSLAGKTSPVPGTESVLPAQVERAKIMHDGDTIALALAVLAVATQAVSTLATLRAAPPASTSLLPPASAMESELATTNVVGRNFTRGPLTITMAADGKSATIVHADYPKAMIMANADGLTFYEMLPAGSRVVGQQPWVTVRGVTPPIAGALPPGPAVSTSALTPAGPGAPPALAPVPTVPALPAGPVAPPPLALTLPQTLPQALATPVTVGPADIAAMRTTYNLPADIDTLAVGRTDIPELSGLPAFQGASREPRSLASTNIPSPTPYYVAPTSFPVAQEHAEQDIVNAFREAVTQKRLTPSQVKGALRIHISNSTGVCVTCRQSADSPTGAGVLTQLSMDYRDLTIRVTWIGEDARMHGFVMVDGHINLRF